MKAEHSPSRLQSFSWGYYGAGWHHGPMWCMFAVNAEITVNASERAPPAEQYVLHPSGRAVCRPARKNFLPPSTWQGSQIHAPLCVCLGGGHLPENRHPSILFVCCDKNLPPSDGLGKKKQKQEEWKERARNAGMESQAANPIYHYHNWLRSWLVDNWFMSSWCKPRREDGNILIYLLVTTAGGSPGRWWRPQIRLIHGRLLSACHKSSRRDTDFFLNWSTWSLCTTCSFLITDKN